MPHEDPGSTSYSFFRLSHRISFGLLSVTEVDDDGTDRIVDSLVGSDVIGLVGLEMIISVFVTGSDIWTGLSIGPSTNFCVQSKFPQ